MNAITNPTDTTSSIDPTNHPTGRTPPARARDLHRIVATLGAIVFWSWNVLLASMVTMGFVPLVFFEAVRDAMRGRLPWEVVATGALLIAVPIAAITFAIRKLECRAQRLPALFYGLEAPLGLLCLARIFLVRELNPGLTHLLFAFFLGAAAFAVELAGVTVRSRWARHAQLAAHAVGVLAVAYVAVLVGFYAVPLGAAFLWGFVRFGWLVELARLSLRDGVMLLAVAPIAVPALFLFAGLFFVTPFALPVLHVRALARVVRAHRPVLGRWTVVPCAAAVAVAAATFPLANRQPQARAFAALEAHPATAADRARLREQKEEIRAGLLNAYLASYRYFGARDTVDLARLYQQDLDLSPEAAARVQRAFVAVAAPLFYDGATVSADGERAERLYRDFFDVSIQKGERDAIVRALTTTYSATDREAGFLARGEKRVHLARQEVTVTERGPVAEVEIHDRWENRTGDAQEVVLVFTLPEEAAITGLWLGPSDDRARRFAARVSPRGAAQAVYRAEVNRRVDPALLEQIGPRQYRLRAYPVPALPRDFGQDAQPLHVWLTYVTFPEGGRWPVPQLAERRNGYWDGATTRVVSGGGVGEAGADIGHDRCDDCWVASELPASPPALTAFAAVTRGGLEIALPEGAVVRREPRRASGTHASVPLDTEECVAGGLCPPETSPPKDPGSALVGGGPAGGAKPLPRAGRRFAVVVDRSSSMAGHEAALRRELAEAKDRLAASDEVDLLLLSTPARGAAPRLVRGAKAADFARAELVAYGGASQAEALAQMDRTLDAPVARAGATTVAASASALDARTPGYDAILFLTDDGGADLARGTGAPVPAGAAGPSAAARSPLWLVHVGGAFPSGYDDGVLARVERSGGGVAGSIAEALDRSAALEMPGALSVAPDAVWVRVAEQPPGSAPAAASAVAPGGAWLAQLAVRQLAVGRARAVALGPAGTELAALDELHGLAVAHRIVSAYSSMIVLVDERQHRALTSAEQGGDRFARAADPEAQPLTHPSSPFDVAGTPEPHEWILIGLAVAGILVVARRRGHLPTSWRSRA